METESVCMRADSAPYRFGLGAVPSRLQNHAGPFWFGVGPVRARFGFVSCRLGAALVQKSFFQRPRGVAIKSVRCLNGVGGQRVGNRIGMHTCRFGALSLRLERCAVTASKSCGPVSVWRRSCPRSLWLCILPFGAALVQKRFFPATARGGHQVGEALERRWRATRWKPNRYACEPIRRPIASAWALCRHGFKIMRARFGLASVLSALALVLYLAVWGRLGFGS